MATQIPARTKAELHALLDKTVTFYARDPRKRRALVRVPSGNTRCCYQTEDGRRCAVGRNLKNPVAIEEKFARKSIDQIAGIVEAEEFQQLFRPSSQGYPLSFWGILQCLHDSGDLWVEKGLSEKGHEQLAVIRYWIESNDEIPA